MISVRTIRISGGGKDSGPSMDLFPEILYPTRLFDVSRLNLRRVQGDPLPGYDDRSPIGQWQSREVFSASLDTVLNFSGSTRPLSLAQFLASTGSRNGCTPSNPPSVIVTYGCEPGREPFFDRVDRIPIPMRSAMVYQRLVGNRPEKDRYRTEEFGKLKIFQNYSFGDPMW